VSRREVRDKRHASQLDLVAVVQNFVDRVRLAARHHLLERGHVFGHGHHGRAGQLLDERVAFHVFGVVVAAEKDLDV
jgi:hypothetical protein